MQEFVSLFNKVGTGEVVLVSPGSPSHGKVFALGNYARPQYEAGCLVHPCLIPTGETLAPNLLDIVCEEVSGPLSDTLRNAAVAPRYCHCPNCKHHQN